MDIVFTMLGPICGALAIWLIVQILHRRQAWLTASALVIAGTFWLTLLTLKAELGASHDQFVNISFFVVLWVAVPGFPIALLICVAEKRPKVRAMLIAATVESLLLLFWVASYCGLFFLA